jgi:hypothetical protein
VQDDEDRRRQVSLEVAHQHAQGFQPVAGSADDDDVARGGV